MASNTRQIRRQIKSIKNTAKITRAMEMISAVKLQKTQAQALASRAYSAAAKEILEKLTLGIETSEHPFFIERPIKKIGIIVMSSNRGLCGSLNGNILKTVFDYEKNILTNFPSAEITYITMGKKIRDNLARLGKNILADFPKPDIALNSLPAIPLANLAIEEFSKNKLDRVVMIFPESVSIVNQKPIALQLLPLAYEFAEEAAEKEAGKKRRISYIFEPTKKQILGQALVRLLETQVFQSLLEANAAEHAARMVAMKNATDSAKDLVDDLTLFYNRTRQAAITQEVSEITSGRLALEN